MKNTSPTALLLNLGHAMDHWVLVIFLYTVSVLAGVWGTDWRELTPYAFGASFMFGAGSLVSPGKVVGEGELWLGNPAKFVRKLSPEQIEGIRYSAQHYVRMKDRYLEAI